MKNFKTNLEFTSKSEWDNLSQDVVETKVDTIEKQCSLTVDKNVISEINMRSFTISEISIEKPENNVEISKELRKNIDLVTFDSFEENNFKVEMNEIYDVKTSFESKVASHDEQDDDESINILNPQSEGNPMKFFCRKKSILFLNYVYETVHNWHD